MSEERDDELLLEMYKKAMKIDFLEYNWEIQLYAQCLHDATLWGRRIDKKK